MNDKKNEMKFHLNNILDLISKLSLNEDNNIEIIKNKISEFKNNLNSESEIISIDLNDVKKISNMIYDLNLNNQFSEETDSISNEYYAFEFLMQEYLKKGGL